MRTRAHLAELLRQTGRPAEAIGHFEALLELNPNDNQGNRDPLLGCYLAAGNLEGARRLLEDYREAGLAVFAWGRVLDYRQQAIGELPSVEVYRESRMTAADIVEFGFRHVAVATGATWRRDGVARWHTQPLRSQ